MKYLRAFVAREYQQFLALSSESRCMLLSYVLVGLADPMISVFTNAFLWRSTHDPLALVVYNGGFFLALSLGFYLNGYLLRRFSVSQLYWVGCVLQGLVPFLVMIHRVDSLWLIALAGLLFGCAAGLFWSNRNLMTLTQTQTQDRLYFGGLESGLGTIVSIAMPTLIGWFLVWGETRRWYSVHQAYLVMGFAAVLILFAAGASLQACTCHPKIPSHLLLRKPSSRWRAMRWLEYIHGVHGGTEIVVPTLVVLTLLGEEASLGLVHSLSAISAALAIYTIGRVARSEHRPHLLGVWIVLEVLASVVFAWWFSATSVIVYTVLVALVANTRWVTLMSLTYDVIDDEERVHGLPKYVFLFDREVFLNLGRVTGLSLFVLLLLFDHEVALRYALVCTALLQGLVFGVARRLNRSFVGVT